MPPLLIRIDPADDVAIALEDLAQGADVPVPGLPRPLRLVTAVPAGHKVALADLPAGTEVRRAGLPIGVTFAPVAAGAHVHVHNLGLDGHRPGGGGPRAGAVSPPNATGARFLGYPRADGRAGTRNLLVVMATVNCAATVVRRIAQVFRARHPAGSLPGIDGLVALTHPQGCSVRADGPGMAVLRRTMAGHAHHPNAAGTLVVGLGCEDNSIASFLAAAGLVPGPRLAALSIQDTGGTAETVARGVAVLEEMAARLACPRVPVPAAQLTVGLQCGGSDGFSGISANPALGGAVDRLVGEGGTALLSETPEVHGAEDLLLGRAATPDIAQALIDRLAWWAQAAAADGGSFASNPSPGNIAGGVTTILEKSLGAVAKGGRTALAEVTGYAERPTARGLVFMDSPGYDPVSATGQVAAGANLIAFTTGRGSCFGAALAPTLKLSSTSDLARRMPGDIDIDCGGVLTGAETPGALADRILAAFLATASGAQTASERQGYGEDEFLPWTPGLIY
jgi:altronate hydrolase